MCEGGEENRCKIPTFLQHLPHLSFNNTGGGAEERALGHMIGPHFSCVRPIKADAAINPSLSVRWSSLFFFCTGFSAAIRCEEATNLTDKDNTAPFLSYSLSCSLFIIISGPGLLSRTSSPAWSPDSDLSTASGLLSFLPVPPPSCPLYSVGFADLWPSACLLSSLKCEQESHKARALLG